MSALIDLVGKKFGRLTVLRRSYPNSKSGELKWCCKCECGKEKIIFGQNLRGGFTQSCGCLQKETTSHLPVGLASMRLLIRDYKRGAKKRGYSYELTEEQFAEITKKDCYYCGIKPYNAYSQLHRNGDYIYNGIDRIDNTKGYTIDNVVSCCKICNHAKNKQTLQEFQDWINRVESIFMGHR